jgi:ABC-type transport system involved in multi-copper enzyme maturation permease subunit
LGLAISAIVKSPTTAMTVMPFILIIQMILSGMLFPLRGTMSFFGNLTISKWGLNATAISADYNNLENTQKIQLSYTLKGIVKQKSLPITDEQVDAMVDENYSTGIVEDYVHDSGKLWRNWGMLALHTAVYAIIAVAALEFVDRDKR